MAHKVPGTLSGMEIGATAVVTEVGGSGALRQHFLDMGIIPGAHMTLVKYAPMGDPMEFLVHGYELTLRMDEASEIKAEPSSYVRQERHAHASSSREHPGLGEGGRYHVKADEHPLPDGTTLTFALAGNQNSGKTTLFNQLTGSNQHVGNFPGVTVDRKDGPIRKHPDTSVVDLPGIYSLSPYSPEELVSRAYILEENPCGIIDIVDATNIERNLYLTMQLMELDRPMVLALNMMDEVQGNGGFVNVNEMEGMLGIPVVPISAVRNEGVDELIGHALHVAKYQERPGRLDFCDVHDHGGAVHRCLHAVMHLIEDHAQRAGIPLRFAATKLVEGDSLVGEALGLDANELEAIEHIVSQMEAERGLDRAAAIADMRFSFIQKVVDACVTKPRESRERERSQRIDRVLTGRWTGIPAFVAIMGLVCWLSFHAIGAPLQDLMQAGVDRILWVEPRGCRCQPCHCLAGGGRHYRGRGNGHRVSAHHRDHVLLSLASGGYRLHGSCRLCTGPAAAPSGPIGSLHRAHAGGLRLHRARGHGHAHPALRARPQAHGAADLVHELLHQAHHLRLLCLCVLSAACRAGHGVAVCGGHRPGHRDGVGEPRDCL